MKIKIKRVVEVEAKTLEICVKVDDVGFYILRDVTDEVIHAHNGCVPDWVNSDCNNSLEFRIDIETGKILNWKPPTKDKLLNWIEGLKGSNA